MSSSVVWKNLQLFDSAEATREGQKNKKNELQIDAQRRGVKKNLRKAKHEQFLQRSTILGDKGLLLPSLKQAGPKIKKESDKDIVAENLKRLKGLSQIGEVDLKSAEKILKRTSKCKIQLVNEAKKPIKTVFTESDFANFAKNYVPTD